MKLKLFAALIVASFSASSETLPRSCFQLIPAGSNNISGDNRYPKFAVKWWIKNNCDECAVVTQHVTINGKPGKLMSGPLCPHVVVPAGERAMGVILTNEYGAYNLGRTEAKVCGDQVMRCGIPETW